MRLKKVFVLVIDNIKEFLRKSRKNTYILLLWNRYRRIRELCVYHIMDDQKFIKRTYKKRLCKEVNLENPMTFTEKLNWLKLNYRNNLMEQCADKYSVRKYVSECGFDYLLNPLLGYWDNVNDIDVLELPEKFVLKASHGSGWNIICTDKSKLNMKLYKKIMKCWLKTNIYYSGREWVYSNIQPRIICEKYIETNGMDLKDYKIFCFSGKPKYIQVDGDRFTEHKRVYYDTNWNKQNFQYGEYGTEYIAEKPIKLDEMLSISKKLSAPFPFARVDFYNINNKIIFGEITFFPDAGFAKFTPDEMDLEMGKLLELPNKNT